VLNYTAVDLTASGVGKTTLTPLVAAKLAAGFRDPFRHHRRLTQVKVSSPW